MSMTNPWDVPPEGYEAPVSAPPTDNPWLTTLANPQARAALLNAGIAMMQPPSFGDTAASQFGRAIGSGAEAVGRQEAMDRAQSEAESKQQLREASANLAGARANTAAQGLATQSARLDVQKAMEEGRKDRNLLNAKVAISRAYQDYVHKTALENATSQKAADKAAADAQLYGRPAPPPFQPKAIQDYNSFVRNNPSLSSIAGITGEQALNDSGSGAGGAGMSGPADLISEARKAIDAGASKDAVRQRLQQKGITPPDDL